MAAVVILGTAGIVYSREQRQPDTTRPYAAIAGRAADHWHAAIGYYICGKFVPDLPEGDDPLGIHGHGDNIVHIHPFGASSAGKRATLGVFLETVKADISDDKIELPGQETKRNGDKCENGTGRVQTKVWDTRASTDQGRLVEGDPSNLRPKDGQLITIAFVPEGTDIPKPPSEPKLDNLSDVGTPTTISPSTTVADPNASSTTSSSVDPNTSPQVSTSSTTIAPTTTTSRP